MFLELCAIPSPPGQERAVADRVIAELDDIGLAWDEDGAGAIVGSTMGNIFCRLPGRSGEGTPIFLCAHLDTVPADGPLEPVVDEEGIVRNAGGTILGADDKSAVVVMLEAARRIIAEGRPHAGVELLFTPKEEVGLLGAYAFDQTRFEAELGYVYDQAAPIGEIILGAPTQKAIAARFHGRASHAGMYPEEGRSAIFAAARAIADMRLGRIDDQSSANVGMITGGTARNIVPEWCSFDAEARSRDPKMVGDPRPGDARCDRLRRQHLRLHGRDGDRGQLPRLHVHGATSRPCASRPRACGEPATSRRPRSRVAAPTRTSSTIAGFPA